MRLGRLGFVVRVWKFMVISVKTCCGSVWNHPVLVGLGSFIIYLYRSFPFMFSILITSSPVLVCTAVLLGLLLSFGSPNIPELEKKGEERVGHAASSLKTRATVDGSIVKRGAGRDGFIVERRVGKMRSMVENDFEKVSLVDNEVSEVEEDGSISYKHLVEDHLDSMAIHAENGVIDRVHGMPNDLLFEKKREFRGELLGSDGAFCNWELAMDRSNLAVAVHERNLGMDHNKFAADFSDVPKDKDEYLDSGSDGTENSSPDASMADIMPVLDELHPLLGSEEPQPALYAVSERSHGSINDDSVDSDEFENPREEDNDDNEGKGAKTDTEDESKSAIKWTEDDQKNLIELGTSELERNQRLEILIARRKAHKNMNSMTVKNVVNLDGAGIPSHISQISTRQNPFELPYYSGDDLGLPPIPGSAPSILRPRNPFDLPCDSSKEIPDPKGDSFSLDLSGFNQREKVPLGESIFRRHESFNMGSSSWKPFFVPDRVVTEGAPILRQSSEASESKMSSVPDVESVSSVPDEEDNKPNEHGVSRETEQESQSSGNVKSINAILAKNRDVHLDVVEIVLGDGENQLEMESDFYEAATAHMEFDASEIHSEREMVMEDSSSSSSTSSSSSSSSSSETDEEMSDVKGEDFACFEPEDHETKESGFSTQPSFEESEFHCTSSVVDDNQHRDPVYDSSPPSLEKFFSFSSVSANTLAKISEMGLPSTLVSSIGEEPKGHGKKAEQSASSFEEMHVASSDLLNEKKTRARGMAENSTHDVKHAGSLRVSSGSPDHNVVEYFSPDGGSSCPDEGLENVDRRMGVVLDSSAKEDMKTRTNAILPVLEARSAEDIDLAFKQLREGVNVEEVIVSSMIEKLPDNGDIKSKLPVVEAKSLEDIQKAFQQDSESSPADLPTSSGYTKAENNVVLPVLEARSAEDIDLAFKQLHEGVDVEEIIVPSMIEKLQDHAENEAKLPVGEARSLDDIDKVFQQAPESSAAELHYSSGLKNESSKDMKTQTNVVLPVLEAKSAEDIDLAFKKLREGVDVEEMIVPSMIEKQQDYGDIKSKLPVVEARSLEDIDKVFQQALEYNLVELPQSSNIRKESLQVKKTYTNVVLPVLEARSAEDIDLAFKQLNEGVNVEDVIVPSMIEKSQDHGDIES